MKSSDDESSLLRINSPERNDLGLGPTQPVRSRNLENVHLDEQLRRVKMAKYLTGYDSVTTLDLPSGGDVYLAYNDGQYKNVGAVKARFPQAVIRSITTESALHDLDADIADCEKGDFIPASAVQWAKDKIHANKGRPTIYADTSTLPAVRAALRSAGLRGKVDLIEAHYDGVRKISRGTVGKQYQDPNTSGGHWDTDVFLESWVYPRSTARGLSKPVRRSLRVLDRRLGSRQAPLTPAAKRKVRKTIKVLRKALRK